MKKNKKIIFGQPDVGFDEINAINKVIKSKWLGTGPITKKFEEKFRKYKKSKYALAVNSCTAALHVSLITLGIGKGDEVITTPMTFSSTVSSIVHSGATPVLADIDPNTFNINPNLIERKITKKTKAIIVVHLGGLPCDMDEILRNKKKI
jgi:dTDP-4-amino-4,6-dideoxygalactose transaminase